MQTVALHWHVYVLTRSPLALGALGLTRVLPIIVFSLWGGVTADRHDRRRVYGLNALSFVGVLHALLLMRTSGRVEADAGSHPAPLDAPREGLRFVFGTPIMVWTTGLDFFATFFAGSLSLLPIFADQVLHAGPVG